MKFWTNWGTKEYVVFYRSWVVISDITENFRQVQLIWPQSRSWKHQKHWCCSSNIGRMRKHKKHWCCGPDCSRGPYFETFWKVKNEAICWIYFVVWNIFLWVKKQLVNLILVSMTLTLQFWLCPYVMRRCDINIKLRHEKRILLVLCCLTSLTKIDAITMRICCTKDSMNLNFDFWLVLKLLNFKIS
jgi:hypothetical protein